jgi:hypothetical protein
MMLSKYSACALALLAIAGSASAQTFPRRATVANGGGQGDAKCVVEVVVDGAAEVEIRGDNASLRNLKGNPPQWRRFECTAPMPLNPAGFRFRGVDGRGRQQLMQEPVNGAPAVIRIEDPDNGSEGYTFEIAWGAQFQGPPPQGPMTRNDQRGPEGPPPPMQPGPGNRGPGARRFFTDDAVSACQTYVRDQAARRFNAGDVVFRRTRMDDQPGRNDWVTGFFEARSQSGRPRNFQFSCSVDFDNGRVRTADIKLMNNPMQGYGDASNGRVIQACEVSVEQRLTRDGYQRIDFGSASVDDRPGRNDSVVGTASVLERGRPVWFDFSCSVDLQAGTVRSADVNRR